MDDELLDDEVLGGEDVVRDAAELGALLGLDLEADELEVELEGLVDPDDVARGGEVLDVVDDEADAGVFADAGDAEEVGAGARREAAGATEGDDFELVGVEDDLGDVGDGAAGANAEDGGADEGLGGN